MDDPNRMKFDCDQFYLRTETEMERVLGDFKDSFQNTLQIMEMCTLHEELQEKKYFETTHLPVYEIDDERYKHMDSVDYFRMLCEEGCRMRYPDFDTNQEIQDRLAFEVEVIEKMGYPSYFLITWDFIKYARDHDIPRGARPRFCGG